MSDEEGMRETCEVCGNDTFTEIEYEYYSIKGKCTECGKIKVLYEE